MRLSHARLPEQTNQYTLGQKRLSHARLPEQTNQYTLGQRDYLMLGNQNRQINTP